MRTVYLALALLLLPCLVLLMYLLGWIPSRRILVAALVVMAGIDVLIVISLAISGHEGSRRNLSIDSSEVLYADGLVTILRDRIIFHRYGFRSSREVLFSELHAIRALPPTVGNGKWRLGGTSDFETWFPTDLRRFRRDTIFRAEMKRPGGYHVGFTVKDSVRVRQVLEGAGVLHPVCPNCHYDLRASSGRCPECGQVIPGG